MRQKRSRRLRDRRGAALVSAVVTLFLIAGLGAALVRTTLSAREEMQQSARHAQAEWLAEAGLNRAAARLRSQAGYTGETWQVPAVELAGIPGLVEIRLAPDPAAPANSRRKQATITVDYPRDLPRRNRIVKTVVLQLSAAVPANKPETPKKP